MSRLPEMTDGKVRKHMPREEAVPPSETPYEEEVDLGSYHETEAEPFSRDGFAEDYRQLCNFIKYMQKRMDFIAQVTTSPPSWCFSTTWAELIGIFIQQKCLTANIIRSHHELVTEGEFVPTFRLWLGDKEVTLKDLNKESPNVDIPHAQIGAHAFYTILENLIRNAAKYGDRDQLRAMEGQLSFDIRLEETWDSTKPEWLKEFYRVTITDNLKLSVPLSPGSQERDVVGDLNSYLSRPIINPDTLMLMPGSWGMKEIKICAAYLRMINQERIDSTFRRLKGGTEDLPPIIMTDLANREEDKERRYATGNLRFTLYLLRSKRALVVEQEQTEKEKNREGEAARREEFARQGIDYITPRQLRLQVERGEVLRHSFLVIRKKFTQEFWDWQWLSDNINYLPHRIVIIGQDRGVPTELYDLQQQIVFVKSSDFDRYKDETHERLMAFLWRQWTHRNWSKYVLCVRWRDYEKTKAEVGGTESWTGDKVGDPFSRWLVEDPGRGQNVDLRWWLVYDHKDAPDDTALFKQSAFHHSFSSATDTAEMLRVENLDHIKEAAALSVVVIDERIWMERSTVVYTREASKYEHPENKILDPFWRKRRVYIQNTDEILENFEAYVARLQANSPVPTAERLAQGPSAKLYDFLIIHQTIIDSLKSRDLSAFEKGWREIKRFVRWVVIDTGRGQPEQARVEKLRWVEYSNLAECLVSHPGDKFRLAQLLSRLRASSTKGG